MSLAPTDPLPLELAIPRPPRLLLGSLLLLAFIAAFCGAAVDDLAHPHRTPVVSLVASVVWLLCVVLAIVVSLREVGLRQLSVGALGLLSRDHFVRVARPREGGAQLDFAFRLLGRTFHQLIVETSGIEKVTWNTGQGSALAGRDINDWHVAIWFDTQAIRRGRLPDLGPGPSLHIVGLDGPRSTIEPFGLALVDLCRRAGLEFEAGEGRTQFVVLQAAP